MACTFGNSFTLPALLFTTMLAPATAEVAIGQAALFLLTMDGLVWSVCLPLVRRLGGSGGGDNTTATAAQSPDDQAAPRHEPSSKNLASLAVGALSSVLNPPTLAMIVGVLIGLCPALHFLLLGQGGAPPGSAAALPLELSLARLALRSTLEVVGLLAGGALSIQLLVLASSLIGSANSGASVRSRAPLLDGDEREADELQPSLLARCARWAATAVAPSDGLEGRMMLAIAGTRYLIVPLLTLGLLRWVAGRLPQVAGNPTLLLVLLLQSVMPPAQNLVLLLQLCEGTRAAAAPFARLLLKVYAVGALPMTLWVAAFAGVVRSMA